MELLSAPGYTLITYIGNTNRDNYNVYVRYTKEGLKKQYEVTANIIGVNVRLLKEILKY